MRNTICSIALLAGLLAGGCGGASSDSERESARRLYAEEKKLLEVYIDSLKHLPDTVNAARLLNNFQERLWEINSSYPPDTDYRLTQGENEVLFKMTRNLIKLATRRGVNVDSVIDLKTDTVVRIEFNPAEAKKPAGGRAPSMPKPKSATIPAPAAQPSASEPAPAAASATPAASSAPAEPAGE